MAPNDTRDGRSNPTARSGTEPLAAYLRTADWTLGRRDTKKHAIQQALQGSLVGDVAVRIVQELARARRVEVQSRFAIGDTIHLVRVSNVGAVRRLAQSLMLDESGLQRIARVAERIAGAERDALMVLTDARGLPLTWSHLEELHRVRGAVARLTLAREVLAQHLTVRELRSYIRRRDGVQTKGCPLTDKRPGHPRP